MKKMLFATLMSLSICSLNAYSPYLNTQTNVDGCTVDCFSSGKGISVNADFLWWDTRAEGLATTIRVFEPGNETVNIIPFDYRWKPGYRIELGYVACLGGYEVDLFAKWTWFRTNYDVEFSGDGDPITSVEDPLIEIIGVADLSFEYNASAAFLYERLDVGLMSNTFEIGYFTFKPSAAVTFAYLEDTYDGLAEREAFPARSSGKLKGKFSGAGVTIAANVVYPIRCDTFLYSNTELTGLWGEVKVDAITTQLETIFSPLTITRHYNESFWAGRLIVGQELGIGYSRNVRSFPVSGHVGWQFLYLPNFNMLTKTSTFYDKTVNGLIAGITVGF